MDRQNQQSPEMNELLAEIDDFLAVTGMGPSYFGKVSAGNSELVDRLRRGGEVRRRTERLVREYIRQQRILRPVFGGETAEAAE